MQKRRFSRIRFEEKCVLEYGNRSIRGRLLNISLKGVLVAIGGDAAFLKGGRWRISFHLGNPDFVMRFGAEVVRTDPGQVAFSFVEADLNSMFHLRNLLEARVSDPERLRGELDCLFADDHFLSSPVVGQAEACEAEGQTCL